MTNEERDIISQFIARVSGVQQAVPAAPRSMFAGSVPAAAPAQPPLPPVDQEADAYIGALFQQMPEARYRLTQLAFVQEHALAEAQNRLQRLEWELQQAQQAAQQAQQAAQLAEQQRLAQTSGQTGGQGGGGIFSGLFGGRTQAPPPPGPPQSGPPQSGPVWNGGAPQPGYQQAPYQQPGYQQPPPSPQYAPNYQPGMFQQRGGSGFLGSALTTAAGVAGGMMVGNALMGLFSGHQNTGFGGSPFGGGMNGGMPGGSPWAAAPSQQDYVDQGTWDNGATAPSGNQDYVDNGSWDQPAADPSSSADYSGGGDSWDSSCGDSGGGDSRDSGGSDGTF